MNRRERVKKAISFDLKQLDEVPYHLEFTVRARQKMIAHLGTQEFERSLAIPWRSFKPVSPKSWVEIQPSFFRDEWDITWR